MDSTRHLTHIATTEMDVSSLLIETNRLQLTSYRDKISRVYDRTIAEMSQLLDYQASFIDRARETKWMIKADNAMLERINHLAILRERKERVLRDLEELDKCSTLFNLSWCLGVSSSEAVDKLTQLIESLDYLC